MAQSRIEETQEGELKKGMMAISCMDGYKLRVRLILYK
jgi:hypothetical protein